MSTMLDRERYELILRLLARGRYARVSELAGLLRSSPATVRRDLTRLEQAGLLRRVRGGAELARAMEDGREEKPPQPPFEARQGIMLEKKRRIARRAAALCEEEETIMIDGGSTTFQMVEFLRDARLQIITNSFAIAEYLVNHSANTIILNGGTIYRDSRLVLDPFQDSLFRRYYASRVFMGVYGIDELGATNNEPLLIQAERTMIEQARRLVILADSSKFGRRGSLMLCGFEKMHTLITDSDISPQARELVESRGVELIVV